MANTIEEVKTEMETEMRSRYDWRERLDPAQVFDWLYVVVQKLEGAKEVLVLKDDRSSDG